jgi:peptidoglycan/LPS O-acetylase OafA/YrhL
LAASYVVAFHAVIGFYGSELSGPWRLMRRLFAFGHEAVAVFIVLSGYCLMLPVLRGSPRRLHVSFFDFIGRRAFRILPPYYAALGGSLLLLACVPSLRAHTGTTWDDSLPGLAVGPIVTHLLVVHNWSPHWGVQINGPLWSVATEWQIYFFFPLLLLPVWRRFGMLATLCSAALFGYAPLALAPGPANLAIPWYLVLFTFGMCAAAVGFSEQPLERRLRESMPWARISGGAWLLCVLFGTAAGRIWFSHKPLTDLLVGFATAALLINLTHRSVSGTPSRLLELLESRPIVGLGHFSYSLYLTHLPVLALGYIALRPLGLSTPLSAVILLGVGGAASLAVAWAFYLLVERRFLRLRRGSQRVIVATSVRE